MSKYIKVRKDAMKKLAILLRKKNAYIKKLELALESVKRQVENSKENPNG